MHEQTKDKQSNQGEKVSPLRPDREKTFYRHYKGGTYLFLAAGTLESNLEPMVIYRRTDDVRIFIRPLSEFHEVIEHNGKKVRRFEPINGE